MIPRLIIHPEIEKREHFAKDFISKLGFDKNHPDLMWLKPEEKLGIEKAQRIKDFLKLKPYKSKGQTVIIICAENLTLEAQNALLKIFEEHQDGVNLVLGVASEEQLLPTLLSRCQIEYLKDGESKNPLTSGVRVRVRVRVKYQEEIERLLKSSIEERFKFIEKLDDKENFLYALTTYFRNQMLKDKADLEFLKELIEAEKWIKANVNTRAVLEYLMLKMPKFKD